MAKVFCRNDSVEQQFAHDMRHKFLQQTFCIVQLRLFLGIMTLRTS